MRQLLLPVSAAALVLGLISPPPASAQQSINVFVGGFVPRSADSRGSVTNGASDDVLVNNLGCRECFEFELGDFSAATVGGEWLVGLGRHLEGGLGVGLYTRTVPTVYANFTDADQSEIEQDLKLRIVPFSATVRVLPFGRGRAVEPYIGAGVGVFAWRYSETGDFINFATRGLDISPEIHVGSGSTTGPIVLAGVRVPVGSLSVGGEVRYQSARGKLPTDQKFEGTTIDLGGWNYLATLNVRF
jgi:hypothetical protein